MISNVSNFWIDISGFSLLFMNRLSSICFSKGSGVLDLIMKLIFDSIIFVISFDWGRALFISNSSIVWISLLGLIISLNAILSIFWFIKGFGSLDEIYILSI